MLLMLLFMTFEMQQEFIDASAALDQCDALPADGSTSITAAGARPDHGTSL